MGPYENLSLDKADFRPPDRRPWLVMVVVVAVVALAYKQYHGGRSAPARGDLVSGGEPVPTETVEAKAVPTKGKSGSKRTPAPTATKGPARSTVAPMPAATPTPVPRAASTPAPVRTEAPRESVAAVDVNTTLAQAKALDEKGAMPEAREAYQRLLKQELAAPVREEVERNLSRIDVELAFGAGAMPEKKEYVVKRNDSLDKIAKTLGTTVELLQRGNNIKNPNMIQPGDRLRALVGKFSIVVDKSANDLVLNLNGSFFKRYQVGTGKGGKTPVGTFVIDDKIRHPPWWRPDGKKVEYSGDPKGENILGTHWLRLTVTGNTPPANGYGIHGTWDEASIGKAESAGCIRMRNREVEELFGLVTIGTQVEITE